MNLLPPEPAVKIVNRSEVKTEVNSLPSDDIELECELSRTNAVAKWYKDGRRLNENERFCEEEEGAFRSLVILNAELEDCGDYFLDAGDDNITFHVTVQGKESPNHKSSPICYLLTLTPYHLPHTSTPHSLPHTPYPYVLVEILEDRVGVKLSTMVKIIPPSLSEGKVDLETY